MRINPTALFTFCLLSLTVGTGVYGFVLGSGLAADALAGVTQPELGLSRRSVLTPRNAPSAPVTPSGDPPPSPASPGDATAPSEPQPTAIPFLSEAEILKQVQALQRSPAATGGKATAASNITAFPFITQNQGVILEVRSAKVEEDMVILETSLRNDSTEVVRFLYSFLKVTTDKGESISATVEDLPGEVAPSGSPLRGSIRIPKAVLEGVKTLSLSLTDYPDQTLRLELSNIPVP